MQKRQLGHSGIEISAMGIGCWAMGGTDWGGGADDTVSINAIRTAIDMGINFFDTADVYGMGHSEEVLGEAVTGQRDKVVLATKFVYEWDSKTREWIGPNTSPDYIRSACEASLKRLKTDYIDLYQFHWNDYGPDGAEAIRDLLEDLVSEGKIRTYGWSTDYSDRARIFAQGANCSAIQSEVNVIDDSPEIIAVCEEFNLSTINRGPLAMGLLTGKYTQNVMLPDDDLRGPNSPDWMKYFKDGQANTEWLNKVTAISDILKSDGRTLAQGAIAWLWARSNKTIPIPGFRNTEQVVQNCKALEFGALSPEQMTEINQILDRVVA